MVKQLDNKQSNEITFIKEWCLTIIDFMISRYGENLNLKKYAEVVNDSFKKKNLKGLRYVYNDTNEWAKGMSQSDLEELNKLLQNQFGKDLFNQKNSDLIKIAKIIKKKQVSNEDEYRLLLSRVDEIYDDESKKAEIDILNKLLANFHKS